MKNKKDKDRYSFIVVLVFMLFTHTIFGIAMYHAGFLSGTYKGAAAVKKELQDTYDSDIEWYKSEAGKAWHSGYDFAKAESDKECEDQLASSNALCKEDLHKAYILGEKAELKRHQRRGAKVE